MNTNQNVIEKEFISNEGVFYRLGSPIWLRSEKKHPSVNQIISVELKCIFCDHRLNSKTWVDQTDCIEFGFRPHYQWTRTKRGAFARALISFLLLCTAPKGVRQCCHHEKHTVWHVTECMLPINCIVILQLFVACTRNGYWNIVPKQGTPICHSFICLFVRSFVRPLVVE